jgi:hypothetical protein
MAEPVSFDDFDLKTTIASACIQTTCRPGSCNACVLFVDTEYDNCTIEQYKEILLLKLLGVNNGLSDKKLPGD